ncbi:hypothetical protein [Burkholderia sp. Ac-20365]|uniref:hypothetical protein n=1 Tax=Burkholderia sp. Ac-20365 TaxID=2703897 RepID=UPI00197C47C5|nr:hypothetical protein [Burkholderia sp. Ac-20365]MBN3761286.1 hypothetical protein [Burkholderia sp. Ac-20365]
MGKKLSDEQKSASKAAQKVRDHAFSARRRAYHAARQSLDGNLERTPEHHASRAAYDAVERRLKEHAAERESIDAQIAALQEQLEGLRVRQRTECDTLKRARDEAFNVFDAKRTDARQKLDAQYADVAGIFSVCQWVVRAPRPR